MLGHGTLRFPPSPTYAAGRVYMSESAARRGSSVRARVGMQESNISIACPKGFAVIGLPASRVDMYLIEQSTN